MHRTKFERLKDDLIGEAVLTILKENGPITFASLANRLLAMANVESNDERKNALIAAEDEVRQRITGVSKDRGRVIGDYDVGRIRSLFKKDTLLAPDKKH
ncbi:MULTISPECIES: hypothetical protein [Enterobacter]|jgi:probable RcsB/C two-component-system connector|uniref:Uncharacterized protein n=1 Tax=Enterobacter cancerogenus TaxID=69218 RepID=A0AAP8NXH7_9ENTR|nr:MULTISPECIES: hypothetical protein [Enterobacter]AUJ81710.1 hypothetical protein CWI88_11915 [Enterobacter cancerogenus]EFC57533.1 hypothetical protein ENTCAN_06050 [Enterobacter cancerogenus ATCC 35316]EKS7426407.1 hypothetical protein [Enterobacter cancerogenus]KTQ50519.1 hypothetical protein NS104_03415 [Enterobacter cancerogenus]KTQ54536.1 hypothetical protein NS111_02290 [Enterobacter cancerogenus]